MMYEDDRSKATSAAEAAAPSSCSSKKAATDSDATDLAATAFRLEEKRYRLYQPDPRQVRRQKQPAPTETDFRDVVDPRNLDANTEANRNLLRRFVLGPPSTGAEHIGSAGDAVVAVTFDGVPGLTIFPDVVPRAVQRQLSVRALTEYAAPPHPNNRSALDPTFVARDGYEAGMRWSTLGFSYDWTKRVYHADRHSPFPRDLQVVIASLVRRLPADEGMRFAAEGYEAQTAIVNYYPVGSSMCAHQDLSEVSIHRPLVSLSLGCSCVFLMGTQSRNDKPHAFWLRSGDVAVFTGPSRLAYHAVPRIMDDTPSWLLHDAADDNASRYLQRMQGLRVNINVRQVYDEPQPQVVGCESDGSGRTQAAPYR
jgi:alkylated DNA repair protein alkB family protein 1